MLRIEASRPGQSPDLTPLKSRLNPKEQTQKTKRITGFAPHLRTAEDELAAQPVD
jgi:hypothetical protein